VPLAARTAPGGDSRARPGRPAVAQRDLLVGVRMLMALRSSRPVVARPTEKTRRLDPARLSRRSDANGRQTCALACRPGWTMCEPPVSALGAPESIGSLETLSLAETMFTPSMFDRAVRRAFGWAFTRAVSPDRRQCSSTCTWSRIRGSSACRPAAGLLPPKDGAAPESSCYEDCSVPCSAP
jgi:hypothetical protein